MTAVPAALLDVLTAPDGPGTPFGTPWLAVLDTARLLCAVTGIIVCVATPWAVTRSTSRGQRARFVALAAACLMIVGTELDHLGNTAHYRLPLAVVAVAAAGYGLWVFRRDPPAPTCRCRR